MKGPKLRIRKGILDIEHGFVTFFENCLHEWLGKETNWFIEKNGSSRQ